MSQSIPTWCWYCKQEIPVTSDQCPFCGKPLNEATKVVRCRKCGKFLLLNTPRCLQCGEPTPVPAPPEAPEQPAPQAPPAPEGFAQPGITFPPDAANGIQFPEPGQTPGGMGAIQFPEPMANGPHAQGKPDKRGKKKGASGGQSKGLPKIVIIIAAVVALLAVGAGVYFGLIRGRTQNEKKPEGPAYCAEDKHQWVEADCTKPKTCSVCGKTEGEAAGHRYVENVCSVCGKPERLFYFSESASERSNGEVVFHGMVKNFTDGQVDSLTIGLQLYDENKKLVSSLSGVAMTDIALGSRESIPWQIRCKETETPWKYWRVYVEDYSPK